MKITGNFLYRIICILAGIVGIAVVVVDKPPLLSSIVTLCISILVIVLFSAAFLVDWLQNRTI